MGDWIVVIIEPPQRNFPAFAKRFPDQFPFEIREGSFHHFVSSHKRKKKSFSMRRRNRNEVKKGKGREYSQEKRKNIIEMCASVPE